jgi:ribosomal protein S18 acetylase RimI-like enzyme
MVTVSVFSKLILALNCLIFAHSFTVVKFLTPNSHQPCSLFSIEASIMQGPPTDYHIDHAILGDALEIVSCTNDAYIADQFFKKPEYHDRFTGDDVRGMIQAENSVFIVAKDSLDGNVCGSIYLQWSSEGGHIVGKFSAVAVRGASQQRGLGKLLVRSAEKFILDKASAELRGTTADLTMGVINLREDLFPWYRKQGFHEEGEMPWDAELARIIKEGYEHVCLIKMRKKLL